MQHGNPRWFRAGLAALAAIGLVGDGARTARGAEEPRKIGWRDDLGRAQAEAKSRDLLLWIQFSGPWCINCRRMDRSAFVHPGVVAESRERFVPVKLRADEHEPLTTSLGLTTLPATVIVRPDGEVVEKIEGYNDAEAFEALLKSVLVAEGRSAEQVAERARIAAARLAISGYCPVALVRQQRLVPGRADLAAEHDGRTFRFADAAARRAFLDRPGDFAPANDGRSPVSQVDRGDFQPGDPRWGAVYLGHLFLFRDADERGRFAADPGRYAHVDLRGRAACPECRSRPMVASRASGRFSAGEGAHGPDPAPPSAALAGRLDAWMTPTSAIRR